jgi:hypothetical protein
VGSDRIKKLDIVVAVLAVLSEPVSGPNSLLNRELTGKFLVSGLTRKA